MAVVAIFLVLSGFFGSASAEVLWSQPLAPVGRIKVDSSNNIVGISSDTLYKVTPDGAIAWQVSMIVNMLNSIDVDPQDNIILTGDSYVWKYGPDGGLAWRRDLGQPVMAASADSAGNIYVSGDTTTTQHTLKLAPDGSLVWSADQGLPEYASFIFAADIVPSPSGVITVVSWTNYDYNSKYWPYMHYVTRYDSDGVRLSGEKYWYYPEKAKLTPDGRVMLVGWQWTGSCYQSVAEYDDGTIALNGNDCDSFTSLAFADDGKPIVVGWHYPRTTTSPFLRKYDGPNYWQADLSMYAADIAVDREGSIIVADRAITKMTFDADGDGYGIVADCKDADAAIHPGAAETCDGIDNNCNGLVDEGFPPVFGIAPTNFSFVAVAGDVDPPAQTLVISNTGCTALNWIATASDPWLGVSPSSGTNDGTVNVTASAAGLAPGVWSGSIVLSAPGADPVSIPVNFITTIGAPQDCVVSAWSDWSACSAPCGGGTQTSTRSIVTPAANGGAACPTDLSRSQDCNTQPCPVNVTVTATDPNAGEPYDPGTFTVTRAGSTTGPLTVAYTVGGSATSGMDYRALRETVTIPAGATAATIVVAPINDTLVEPAEDVIVTLGASPAYMVGTPSTATVTIADNDTRVSIAATDPLATESGADSGTFTVTRTGETEEALTVAYTVAGTATPSGGGPDGDYSALSGTVTIPANQTTATIMVTPVDDTSAEPNETVIVTLVAKAYTVAHPSRATVTILDNDTSVSIVATDPSAGEPSDPGTFTLTRKGWITGPLSVVYTASGSATGGLDYLALRGTVTIPAGAAAATIVVTPINDIIVEPAEDVVVTLSASPAYTLGAPATATVTIADNDTRVNIAATDPIAAESGADSGTFTVTREGYTMTALTVAYTVSGTATPSGGVADGDYSALSGTVTILANETTATITLTPSDDDAAEPNETVILNLNAQAYTVVHPSRATVTIVDNDTTVSIAATDPSAGEPAEYGTFTLTRTGWITGSLTVAYTVSGSAIGDLDYRALRGTVTIPAGAATATILVNPINDYSAEPAEDVVLTLSESPAYTLGTPAIATVTIADNDTRVSIAATDPSAAEFGAESGTFTVTREGYTLTELTVAYTVSGTATPSGGGADGDYSALSGTVTILAHETTATITVTPIDDTSAEPNETVIVRLVARAYSVVHPSSATVTILDNDTTVSIAATDPSAGEPSDRGTFTLTRTGWIAGSLTVAYAVSGSTTGGLDYLALRGTVNFPAGATTATVVVIPIDDTSVEPAEDVVVTLSTSPDYTLGAPSTATVTIADNDTRVSIAATDPLATESGADSGTFTVTRTGETEEALTVAYTVAGTATPSGGGPDGDYSALSGTVTIPANQTTATIMVTPVDDTSAEPNETVIVTLVAKAYTVVHPTRATVTILDNDTTVSIAATDSNAGEPYDRGTFTLTRTGWITGPLTVAYAVSGSATSGLDYLALRGMVTFPAGAATATIVVTPINDTIAEPAEDVVVALSASPTYTLGTPSTATVTITDND